MTNPYAAHVNPGHTPQSEPLPGREEDQVKNRAGGYVFPISPWDQLKRFLILGAEGSTYYASEREMVLDNARALRYCVGVDAARVLSTLQDIDRDNRAPKAAPTVFALAYLLKHGPPEVKTATADAVQGICRTASHLFSLLAAIKEISGQVTGRATRRAISAWYAAKSPDQLAYQMAKYRQREGFTHQDAIRLGHPEPATEAHSALLSWAADPDKRQLSEEGFADYLHWYLAAQNPGMSESEIVHLIRERGLVRECIPSHHLNSPAVWEALLHAGRGMPIMALFRNLGKLSAVGLMKPLSDAARHVAGVLTDENRLRKGRIHPIQVLSALTVYRQGYGVRGSLSWEPAGEVVDALETALELSFGAVEPTGLSHYLGVDVSASMAWESVAGVPGLTPAAGAAVLALVSAKIEPRSYIRGFCQKMQDLGISSKSSFSQAVKNTQRNTFGSTDCALPMLDALRQGLEVDVFVVITDNETWAGRVHPSEALRRYRHEMGRPAKLIVIGMTSTGYSIADPGDRGMLDIVGFDSSAPQIMRGFTLGEI